MPTTGKKDFDMTQGEMLREVLQNQRDVRRELREHRKDLNDHIRDGNDQNLCAQRQLGKIREEMQNLASCKDVNDITSTVKTNKFKVGLVLAFMNLALITIIGLVVTHMGGTA